MPGLAQIRTLPEAHAVIKAMQLRGWEWADDAREASRKAMVEVLTQRMTKYVDDCLDEADRRGEHDRRNGSFGRHLLTELGDVLVKVPRTRTTSAAALLKAFARRMPEIDRLVLACFVLGMSTRKVGEALLPILGERISPQTVSRISTTLDEAVAAFHKRKLNNQYRCLLFDGVVLSRKTGAGAVKRPVLVALGLREDGKKEVIDYAVGKSESEAEWTRFLNGLRRRGLTAEGVELISVDGGAGMLAALEMVYPDVPIQRCWAHKARNILDKVRKKDRDKAKRDLTKVYSAPSRGLARRAARRFADRWSKVYPAAVRCLRTDLDELLAFYCFKDAQWQKWTRTTNAIERRFREVRRRTRPMGVLADRTSMDRILYAVFTYENKQQGIPPLFLLTQNS